MKVLSSRRKQSFKWSSCLWCDLTSAKSAIYTVLILFFSWSEEVRFPLRSLPAETLKRSPSLKPRFCFLHLRQEMEEGGAADNDSAKCPYVYEPCNVTSRCEWTAALPNPQSSALTPTSHSSPASDFHYKGWQNCPSNPNSRCTHQCNEQGSDRQGYDQKNIELLLTFFSTRCFRSTVQAACKKSTAAICTNSRVLFQWTFNTQKCT